jgi:site-specific recombinase XerD
MTARNPIQDPVIRDFALALAAEGKKPKTVRTYTDAAAWLQRTQELEDWSAVRKANIRAHIALILGEHSPAYASNQFRALQQFFRFLENEEDIKNPMTGLKPPAVPQKLVPVIADGEWSKLIGTCTTKRFYDLRDKATLEFFRSTGARRSEVAGLRVTDIDLDQLAAIVTGKASKMRIVRFDAATGLALSRYLRARKSRKHASSDALWIGGYDQLTSDGVYQMFTRRGEKAGVEINPHRFRHDFSHRYLLNGGQESDLMSQNGWSSASMLRRYGASAAAERARQHYDAVMA